MSAAPAIAPLGLQVPDWTPEHVLTIDFETYWATDFSLTAMGASDYVRDPRFEVIGVGVKDGEGGRVWMEADEFREWAKSVPWDKTAVKCHQAHFDGFILSHHFQIYPAFFFCSLSMARTFGLQEGRGLDDLAQHFGVGQKGMEVYDAKEKRRADFTPEEWRRYGDYCLNDCDLTDAIFDAMLEAEHGYPESELWVIHEHVMMFTRPRIFLDAPLLTEFLRDEKLRKQTLLDKVAKNRKLITSDKLFIAELQAAGLDSVPMKPSPKRKVKKEVTKTDPKTGALVKEMVDTSEALMIPAFSKNDPGMQELLEHEIEMVRWLAETRIAIKSTINETRTERFLKSGVYNGQLRPVPVYLVYYGAHTGRASGSDKRNFQNLQRTNKKDPKKGILRKSLLAPFRQKFVAADSGAIEAKTTAWLAGHETLIDAFAQGRDVYSEFMSEVLGRHVDRKKNPEDEVPGFIGKICVAGETPVLTERGWVPIVEVRQTDRVWDGVEWVTHSGVLDQGVKTVVESRGFAATPDHEMLTGHGWQAWNEVRTNPSLFRSALALANSPCSGGIGLRSGQVGPRVGTHSFDVHADGKGSSSGQTSSEVSRHAATSARDEKLRRSDGGSTKTRSLMMLIGRVFLDVATTSLIAAAIRNIATSCTTVEEAFRCALSGGLIPALSSVTSFNFQGGIVPSWISTESTTIGATSPATSGSPHVLSTRRTSATWPTWSKRSVDCVRTTRVYDLLSAGSRKRFCVLTADGPVIVSNCVLGLGYNMGWPKLSDSFLKGAMNGPPVKFGWDMATQLQVDVSKFISDEWKMNRVNEMITRVPKEDLVVHCAVTEAIVKKWRQLNDPIVKLWGQMEQVIEAMLEDDADYSFGPNECLRVVRHAIILPNGMKLRYPGLRYVDGYSYLGEYGKMRKSLYGGKLTENVVQALARIIVTDQMLHVKATTGEDPALFTHDDLAYLIPEDRAPAFDAFLAHTMKTAPSWAVGLPLSVDHGVSHSYGLCK